VLTPDRHPVRFSGPDSPAVRLQARFRLPHAKEHQRTPANNGFGAVFRKTPTAAYQISGRLRYNQEWLAIADLPPRWADDKMVPPEFRGLARAARVRFLAAETVTGPMMKAIEPSLAPGTPDAVHGRSTSVALRHVQAVADRWRKTLSGILAQAIVLDGRNLTISDTRVTASTWDAAAQTMGSASSGTCSF
jgi:hypothetical protein